MPRIFDIRPIDPIVIYGERILHIVNLMMPATGDEHDLPGVLNDHCVIYSREIHFLLQKNEEPWNKKDNDFRSFKKMGYYKN